jgi:hypothetical protein
MLRVHIASTSTQNSPTDGRFPRQLLLSVTTTKTITMHVTTIAFFIGFVVCRVLPPSQAFAVVGGTSSRRHVNRVLWLVAPSSSDDTGPTLQRPPPRRTLKKVGLFSLCTVIIFIWHYTPI